MGQGVILVRHAAPEMQRGVAAKLWTLSTAGREDCVLLAHALPEQLAPTVFSSPEPKALQTAAVIALRRGLDVFEDSAFAEVDRPQAWEEDYAAAAAGYLASGGREGWEPPRAVVERFAYGVASAGERCPQRDIVIATHGLALTLYLAAVAKIDAVAFWRALTMPDAWRLDLESGALERLFGAGTVRS